MVVGPIYRKGRIVGGARDNSGKLLYGGLRRGFSGGHLHRASVWQQCEQADFTNAVFREELLLDFLKQQGLSSREELFGQTGEAVDRLRAAWAKYIHDRAMIVLYNPQME